MLRREQDYILRMIAAAAAAVARLRERLIGGAQPDEIVRESRAAQLDDADALERRADALTA